MNYSSTGGDRKAHPKRGLGGWKPKRKGIFIGVTFGGSSAEDSLSNIKSTVRDIYSVGHNRSILRYYRLVTFSKDDRGNLNQHDHPRGVQKDGFVRETAKVSVYAPCGIRGKIIPLKGSVMIDMELGDGDITKEIRTEFMVADIPFTFNAIVGRKILMETCASEVARKTYYNALKWVFPVVHLEVPDNSEREDKVEPAEEMVDMSKGGENNEDRCRAG
ncbi:conserved hypothetical protein [Ricinus communis]|uniref:Uncharacterized protein n=1 Tax=Ricinus communis TaxID=3988 RepID=B9SUM3_RICCO|nr:conserved hypothetical protein [Ricinus communis]